jgi:hypothetical protein
MFHYTPVTSFISLLSSAFMGLLTFQSYSMRLLLLDIAFIPHLLPALAHQTFILPIVSLEPVNVIRGERT